ncbi:unnamed protein product, partial [Polarella glacialis]
MSAPARGFGNGAGAKERMAFLLASLVGHDVTVKLRNQKMYTGMFHSCSTDGDISIVLKYAHGMNDTKEEISTLVVSGKDFLQISAMGVPPLPTRLSGASSSSGFKTDNQIADSRQGGERELVKWVGRGDEASTSLDLAREAGDPEWDQFAHNEKVFGITSTFSEELYTTKLDPSKIPKQKRELADRIAREIESGQNYSRVEEALEDSICGFGLCCTAERHEDVDEETQLSAVPRSAEAQRGTVPLTEESLSQHDAASAAASAACDMNEAGDAFAREHRTKRFMITAHST